MASVLDLHKFHSSQITTAYLYSGLPVFIMDLVGICFPVLGIGWQLVMTFDSVFVGTSIWLNPLSLVVGLQNEQIGILTKSNMAAQQQVVCSSLQNTGHKMHIQYSHWSCELMGLLVCTVFHTQLCLAYLMFVIWRISKAILELQDASYVTPHIWSHHIYISFSQYIHFFSLPF